MGLALKISWASAASAPSECADLNSQCSAWAAMGECVDNPVFMMENCAKSCCGMEFPCVKSHPPASADTDKRCKDTQKQCKEWANEGECVENPLFMAEECPQSCCGHCRVNGNDSVEGVQGPRVGTGHAETSQQKGNVLARRLRTDTD